MDCGWYAALEHHCTRCIDRGGIQYPAQFLFVTVRELSANRPRSAIVPQ